MKSILQIEVTNKCNRCCKYCGQTNMTRPKGHMTLETVGRCIAVLKALGQYTVGLNHYGEPLLHPNFTTILKMMNSAEIYPWWYTNGDLLTDEALKEIAEYEISSMVVSGHGSKEKRIELVERCKEYGIPAHWQIQIDEDNAIDLAGQVKFSNNVTTTSLPDPANRCLFLRDQKAIVLWNGDLVPCCMVYDGTKENGNVFGNIWDLNAVDLNPPVIPLCGQCAGHPGSY